jgi:hypothetical protein
MKTPAGRARKIAALVAMLERGETILPEEKTDSRDGRPARPRRRSGPTRNVGPKR